MVVVDDARGAAQDERADQNSGTRRASPSGAPLARDPADQGGPAARAGSPTATRPRTPWLALWRGSRAPTRPVCSGRSSRRRRDCAVERGLRTKPWRQCEPDRQQPRGRSDAADEAEQAAQSFTNRRVTMRAPIPDRPTGRARQCCSDTSLAFVEPELLLVQSTRPASRSRCRGRRNGRIHHSRCRLSTFGLPPSLGVDGASSSVAMTASLAPMA